MYTHHTLINSCTDIYNWVEWQLQSNCSVCPPVSPLPPFRPISPVCRLLTMAAEGVGVALEEPEGVGEDRGEEGTRITDVEQAAIALNTVVVKVKGQEQGIHRKEEEVRGRIFWKEVNIWIIERLCYINPWMNSKLRKNLPCRYIQYVCTR